MEVEHHCPQAIPHSAGGCCSSPTLIKEPPPSSPSASPASPASPLQCPERSARNTANVDTKQQIKASGEYGNDELSCIMTRSECAVTHSNNPDQLNAEVALSFQDGQQQRSSTIPLPSCHNQEGQQNSAVVPPLHPCTLDPNAREFTPSLPAARPMEPFYSGAQSEIRVSVCYQASVSAMEGPCNDELVDTSLRLGLYSPNMAASAPDSKDSNASTNQCPGISPVTNGENVAYTGFAKDYMGGYEHQANEDINLLSGTMDTSPQSTNGGVLGPLHGSPTLGMFNPPILSFPSPIHLGFFPAMSMAMGLPPQPASMPPYLPAPISHPNCMPDITAQQALTVYSHKNFHPRYGWKEHISRALLISGVPPHLDASHLHQELEQWGHVRAFHVDRLPQGILCLQFFDLRASRQALRDMQNQHLLRQQRFQQYLHAQSGMQFHSCMIQAVANEGAATGRGLLCGNVVWAQYVASPLVPCPSSHNQGTLVLFNVDEDVGLQELRKVFEKYGDVREMREAPTKRHHKFVEYYDTRNAEAAWAALNGQEVCGKCVKIEFSRHGGPVRKQKNNIQSVRSHLDLAVRALPHMQQMHDLPEMDLATYGWQDHMLCQHEWHVGDHIVPSPSLNEIVAPSTNGILSHEDSVSRCHGRYVKQERGFLQGAIAGPRRKQSGFARSHSKLYHMVIHEPGCGTDDSFAVLPASRKFGGLQKNLNLTGHPQFEYDERDVISGQPRTTLMIKNIPNKYSQQMLLSLLDHHCVEYNSQVLDLNEPESAYDFVYLPIDFKNRCNLGYAFVNFTTALATLKFYKAFHARPWEAFNSRKICEIKYARVQGRSALENHFCNSRFACDTMEYLPVVFLPPRNGLVCPSPIAAAGLMTTKSGRLCPRTAPKQPSLQAPPPCKLMAESQPHKFTPESKPLLENVPLSDSGAESTIRVDNSEHDTTADTTLPQV